MNPPVPQLAVAVGPLPVPVVVQILARQRHDRGRAGPEIVVERGGDRLRAAHLADAAARREMHVANHQDLAEVPLTHVVQRFRVAVRSTRSVGALHDALVLAGRLDHLPAFEDVVGSRFLDVHVLAGLAGPDRHQRVPVIGRGDHDGVDVLAVQELAHVGVSGDLFVAFLETLHLRAEIGVVHVAEGHDANAGDLPETADFVPALATDLDPRADADHGQSNVIVGAGGSQPRGRAEVGSDQRGGSGRRSLEKTAAGSMVHHRSSRVCRYQLWNFARPSFAVGDSAGQTTRPTA